MAIAENDHSLPSWGTRTLTSEYIYYLQVPVIHLSVFPGDIQQALNNAISSANSKALSLAGAMDRMTLSTRVLKVDSSTA